MENLDTKHRQNHLRLSPRVQVAVVEGVEQVGVALAAAVVEGHLKRHSRLQVADIDPRVG